MNNKNTGDGELGKELFEMVYQWGRVGLVVDETAPAFNSVLKTLIAEEVDKAYLRGYNSGWVKANRLTTKPQTVEFFASQLEEAAKTLRESVATLKSDNPVIQNKLEGLSPVEGSNK